MAEVRMRAFTLTISFLAAVLFPIVGSAQVYPLRSAAPEVTAATADWQINSEPIVVDGAVYLPTRAMRLFDGEVMTQVGIYQRVPVYADVTLEPNSILYVPVGRDRMRTYERRRARELASTTGSRTPSFPVEPAGTASVDEGAVGTAGSVVPSTVGSADVFAPVATAERPRRTKVE